MTLYTVCSKSLDPLAISHFINYVKLIQFRLFIIFSNYISLHYYWAGSDRNTEDQWLTEEVCHSIRNLRGSKLCLLANGTFLKTFISYIPLSFRVVTLSINDVICAGRGGQSKDRVQNQTNIANEFCLFVEDFSSVQQLFPSYLSYVVDKL